MHFYKIAVRTLR